MRVAVVLGTRPEIIKMSPIIRELKDRGLDFHVIHTGQHYDHEISDIFFQELNLDAPDRYLGIGSGEQGEQTGKALIGLEKAYLKMKSELVLVQGDTNTVLAGALAGVKIGLKVGHVEAGLRSYDLRMPEEHNRRLTDHCSHFLFAPTEHSASILKEEKVWGNIHVTGNTVIDACIQNMEIAEEKAFVNIPSEYVLITAHRSENVDDRSVLKQFIEVFENIPIPKVYPVHPRAEKMFKQTRLYERLKNIEGMYLIKPQGYLEFLMLMRNARYILTDSGGIQEEATSPNIKKKVFVLRESTERPEAVEAGFAEVVGTDSEDILKAIDRFEEKGWKPSTCPYGDGKAAKRIVDIISR
ncbi:MAG: UDP-N-acetylglucosamine 2-epimerase (non-hydrolyzing) [Thermoplasmata archaeon]